MVSEMESCSDDDVVISRKFETSRLEVESMLESESRVLREDALQKRKQFQSRTEALESAILALKTRVKLERANRSSAREGIMFTFEHKLNEAAQFIRGEDKQFFKRNTATVSSLEEVMRPVSADMHHFVDTEVPEILERLIRGVSKRFLSSVDVFQLEKNKTIEQHESMKAKLSSYRQNTHLLIETERESRQKQMVEGISGMTVPESVSKIDKTWNSFDRRLAASVDGVRTDLKNHTNKRSEADGRKIEEIKEIMKRFNLIANEIAA